MADGASVGVISLDLVIKTRCRSSLTRYLQAYRTVFKASRAGRESC